MNQVRQGRRVDQVRQVRLERHARQVRLERHVRQVRPEIIIKAGWTSEPCKKDRRDI